MSPPWKHDSELIHDHSIPDRLFTLPPNLFTNGKNNQLQICAFTIRKPYGQELCILINGCDKDEAFQFDVFCYCDDCDDRLTKTRLQSSDCWDEPSSQRVSLGRISLKLVFTNPFTVSAESIGNILMILFQSWKFEKGLQQGWGGSHRLLYFSFVSLRDVFNVWSLIIQNITEPPKPDDPNDTEEEELVELANVL